MRSTMATPAPSSMPQRRCRAGRPRHAIAITTALSPDSRMLIQVILARASQNDGSSMPPQPEPRAAAHVDGSRRLPMGSDLADDLVFREELRDLAGGRIRRVRAVHR